MLLIQIAPGRLPENHLLPPASISLWYPNHRSKWLVTFLGFTRHVCCVHRHIYMWWRGDGTLNKCGASPAAMLAVIVIGVFMIAVVVGFGRYHYTTGMPLTGSCSLATSVACHPEQQSVPGSILSERELQWGVNGGCVKGVWHCAFFPEVVGRLKKGSLYA
jgi:hypothetical protein